MVWVECLVCEGMIELPLGEHYLKQLRPGDKIITREHCFRCGTYNYVEHLPEGSAVYSEEAYKELKAKGEVF